MLCTAQILLLEQTKNYDRLSKWYEINSKAYSLKILKTLGCRILIGVLCFNLLKIWQ